MLMKTNLWLAVLMAGLGWNASGSMYSYNWSGIGATIPDADPNGYVNSQTIGMTTQGNNLPANPLITSVVALRIDISGGWNGDLYAYLRYETLGGTGFTTLLNRVGTTASPLNQIGYTTSGMNITLSDSAGVDIHTVSAPTAGGTYRVDQNGSSITFDSFINLDPVGTWSIFLADLSGNHVSQLNSWGMDLNITAVPEPVTWAFIGFGTLFGVVQLGRLYRRRTAAC